MKQKSGSLGNDRYTYFQFPLTKQFWYETVYEEYVLCITKASGIQLFPLLFHLPLHRTLTLKDSRKKHSHATFGYSNYLVNWIIFHFYFSYILINLRLVFGCVLKHSLLGHLLESFFYIRGFGGFGKERLSFSERAENNSWLLLNKESLIVAARSENEWNIMAIRPEVILFKLK